MAQLTADTIMPVVSTLPLEEQRRLMEKLSKRFSKKQKPKKKKQDIYEKIGEEFRPGNEEMLLEKLGIYDEI